MKKKKTSNKIFHWKKKNIQTCMIEILCMLGLGSKTSKT